MNFIKRNFKYVWMSVTLSLFVLMLGLGIGLSAFGMGMESQRFISSVENTIDKYLTKGTVVIDGSKGFIYDMAVSKLQESYATDVLSTLAEEQKNDPVTKKFWEDYAQEKFDQRWKSIVDQKADIDINEFSYALVAFDVQVAQEFHNYGFTHSGLQWIGQKGALADLWSTNYRNTNTYQAAQQNQTIINQTDYQTGTYLVNNKVWFINEQIKTLTSPLIMNAVFKDKEAAKKTLMTQDETGKEVPIQVSGSDFYHPNFTNGFQQTRIGAVFLIILTPLFALVFIGVNLVNYGWLKNILARFNKRTEVAIEGDNLELNEPELVN